MSDPRYEPRRYTVEPSEFARADLIRWREVESTRDRERLYAAQMQHAWCYHIRLRARSQYGSLGKYAEASKQAYDRLARVIRGEGILRLDDMGNANHYLGAMHDEAAQTLRQTIRNPRW